MKSIYLDSNVISLYCAKMSNDVIVLAKQLITYKFWNYSSAKCKRYISDVVLLEISRGDSIAGAERLELIRGMTVLPVDAEVQKLAGAYMKNLKMPDKAHYDAVHIAICCRYRINYIITWNLKHIMNGDVIERLFKYNEKHGVYTPKISTPEIFLGGAEDAG